MVKVEACASARESLMSQDTLTHAACMQDLRAAWLGSTCKMSERSRQNPNPKHTNPLALGFGQRVSFYLMC
eukprot:208119-Amphidinium_carterae.2